MRPNLLTIEGPIGSGKTTVAKALTDRWESKLILEQFADNPFLPKFYKNPDRYAFPLELYFMAERYQQLHKEVTGPNLFNQTTITDYLFTKSLIFAKVTLEQNEFRLYKRLFDIVNPNLPKPELVVYLYAPIDQLLDNIKKRGRDYEQDIQGDYLEKLQTTYMNYFRQSDLRVILLDMENIDFLDDPSLVTELEKIIEHGCPPGIHPKSLIG